MHFRFKRPLGRNQEVKSLTVTYVYIKQSFKHLIESYRIITMKSALGELQSKTVSIHKAIINIYK